MTEVIVGFIDIGGIVDLYFFNFSFIIIRYQTYVPLYVILQSLELMSTP